MDIRITDTKTNIKKLSSFLDEIPNSNYKVYNNRDNKYQRLYIKLESSTDLYIELAKAFNKIINGDNEDE